MGFFKDTAVAAPPYPGVPPSLRHDAYPMQDVHLGDSTTGHRPPPPPQTTLYDSAGDVTPYLGLRARLSQVWLNRWTVLLLLVLVRVLILVSGLHDNIGDAEAQALSACTKVEDVGSAMASMPHYLSVGVNDLAASGISQTVQGLVALLDMVLTGIEQLIIFVINFYVGTYACLSSALIHGGLDVGIGAADEATKLMNTAIAGITKTIEADVSSVQDTINAAFSTIASASSIFGKTLDPPTLNISGPLSDLENIQIDDTGFVSTLAALNTTLPTYDEAENATRQAIAIPFNAVRAVLNNTYGAYTFDTSVFPVAEKTALTFCSGNDTISSFFAALYAVAHRARLAFAVTLALLAVLACVPMTLVELRRWRSQQRRAKLLARHAFDPLDVVYLASRPYTAGAGVGLAARWFRAGKRQLLARWAVAYATSFPALFVLSLAVAGLLSCVCQAVLLAAVHKETPALAAEVSGFADDVVGSLERVSTEWATDANSVLLGFQDTLNDDLLGYVVNATTAVNTTLNVFTAEIDRGINAVFNGTVLDNTVRQVVRCLIGIKIDAVEQGLTWVHDHAHVTLPLFPNDTFSVGARASITNDTSLTSFLADPGTVSSDDVTAAVDKVVTALHNGLVQEALIATALLLVYIVVVLAGVLRATLGMLAPDRTRAEGGQRFYAGVDPAVASGVGAGAGAAVAMRSFGRHHRRSPSDDDSDDDTVRTRKGGGAAADAVFFPRFDTSGAGSSASLKGSITGTGKGRRVVFEKQGHWRSSSHGDVTDADGH